MQPRVAPGVRADMNQVVMRGVGVLVAVLVAIGVASGLGAGAQPAAKTVGFNQLLVDSSVVVVHVRRHTSPTSAVAQSGTGVVLPGGRVVTATHLFKDAWTDVEIVFGGRTGHLEQPLVWKGEPTHVEGRDVTILGGVKVPEWVKPAKVSKRSPIVSDALVSFGLSRPSRPRIRGGIVDEMQASGAIVIDVNSSMGDSGGPTFNQNNELVGIHTGVMTRTWEGKWGSRADVFSLSSRVTDLKEVKEAEKGEKK
jgi:hypothetical protein